MSENIRVLKCCPCSFFILSKEISSNYDFERPFHRICELMRKADAQSVVIHRHVEQEDYYTKQYPHLSEELRDLTETALVKDVSQIIFLDEDIGSITDPMVLRAKIRNGNILSTCVIVTLQLLDDSDSENNQSLKSYVYEAIVKAPSSKKEKLSRHFPQNYTHVYSRINIKVLGQEYKISGSYFMQQNGLDCVCAHSAIKMNLIHVDGNTTLRHPPSSYRINKIVTELGQWSSKGVKSFDPLTGLTCQEIEKVFNAENSNCLILNTSIDRKIPPYEWAYLLIESGIPTIIGFVSESEKNRNKKNVLSHVMCVVGHTLNTDKWFPMAQIHYGALESGVDRSVHMYRSAAEWVCHLVVHDDELGPYYCVSEDELKFHRKPGKGRVNSKKKLDPASAEVAENSRIQYVIGVVPDKYKSMITPYAAQQLGCCIFWKLWDKLHAYIPSVSSWGAHFREHPFTPETLVLRTQRCQRSHYIKHITTVYSEPVSGPSPASQSL